MYKKQKKKLYRQEDKALQFWLKMIDEVKHYFIEKIREREQISKNLVNILEHLTMLTKLYLFYEQKAVSLLLLYLLVTVGKSNVHLSLVFPFDN